MTTALLIGVIILLALLNGLFAMGELGPASYQHHFDLGQRLAQHFSLLLVAGQDAQPVVLGAKAGGMLTEQIIFAATSTDLIGPLKSLVQIIAFGQMNLLFLPSG